MLLTSPDSDSSSLVILEASPDIIKVSESAAGNYNVPYLISSIMGLILTDCSNVWTSLLALRWW